MLLAFTTGALFITAGFIGLVTCGFSTSFVSVLLGVTTVSWPLSTVGFTTESCFLSVVDLTTSWIGAECLVTLSLNFIYCPNTNPSCPFAVLTKYQLPSCPKIVNLLPSSKVPISLSFIEAPLLRYKYPLFILTIPTLFDVYISTSDLFILTVVLLSLTLVVAVLELAIVDFLALFSALASSLILLNVPL